MFAIYVVGLFGCWLVEFCFDWFVDICCFSCVGLFDLLIMGLGWRFVLFCIIVSDLVFARVWLLYCLVCLLDA